MYRKFTWHRHPLEREIFAGEICLARLPTQVIETDEGNKDKLEGSRTRFEWCLRESGNYEI